MKKEKKNSVVNNDTAYLEKNDLSTIYFRNIQGDTALTEREENAVRKKTILREQDNF